MADDKQLHDLPPERFRGAGDGDDGPIDTSRGQLFKWMVWIFGVGGGLALAFAYMLPYLPSGGGGGGGALTEADFETITVQGTHRGQDVTLTAPARQVRQADLQAHLDRAIDRMAELADEMHGDGGPGGGLDALNAHAGDTAVRVSRGFRQAVEITEELSATVSARNAFVSAVQQPDPVPATPPEPEPDDEPAGDEDATEAPDETAADGNPAPESHDSAETVATRDDPAPGLPEGRLLSFDGDFVELLHPGTRLDLGAVADGRIVDLTAAGLQDEGLRTFALSWGNITFYSGDFSGFPWVVGVRAPDDSGQVELYLSGRAVVRAEADPGAPLAGLVTIGGRADRAAGLATLLVARPLDEAQRAVDLTVGTDALFFPAAGGAQMTPGMAAYLPGR